MEGRNNCFHRVVDNTAAYSGEQRNATKNRTKRRLFVWFEECLTDIFNCCSNTIHKALLVFRRNDLCDA